MSILWVCLVRSYLTFLFLLLEPGVKQHALCSLTFCQLNVEYNCHRPVAKTIFFHEMKKNTKQRERYNAKGPHTLIHSQYKSEQMNINHVYIFHCSIPEK